MVCLLDVSTPTFDFPTIKMLWNSVLSTPIAKFFTLDLANFYLGTPMARAQYMRLPIKTIPQEIIDKYNLNDIEEDGWVYVEIVKGMYVLPGAGKIANDLLKILGQGRLLPKPFHTRSVETCVETHHIHISCR